MVGAALRQTIRRHRRAAPLRLIASACEKFLRAWHNEDFYDFARNGEAFALRTAASYFEGRSVVIWDVGAHHGQWALEARGFFPRAVIHSFEIMPHIAEKLTANVRDDPAIIVHNLGLSDTPGPRMVHWNQTHDTTNAISPRTSSSLFRDGTTAVACESTTGDLMATRIPRPTILKIDVEGHEVAVLKGACELLGGPDSPVMIQFEYGETYLPSGSTLGEVYEALAEGGYQIGRLFPNHVNFKAYALSDDNFRMGNFVAVRDERLAAKLN